MVLIIPRIPPLATRSSGWRAWRPTQSSLGGSGWHDEVRCRFAVRRLDFFLFSFCFLFVFFLFSFCFLFVFFSFLQFYILGKH